ncbi:MAG: DUF1835 domain-containing protein, partial [Motiliproteus sp.]|nr:DUF1835 domain-containing protein [Motiliproteus sp.]
MSLHITNGDSVGEMLKETGLLSGQILCWRDLLHDGPLLDLPFDKYAQRRAAFIFQQIRRADPQDKSFTEQSILDDFKARQACLERVAEFEQITLWFEHDLYDQLQLIEVLYRLSQYTELPPVRLICIGSHSQVEHFFGLADLTTQQLQALESEATMITDRQWSTATDLWQAMTDSSPLKLQKFLSGKIEEFPFMAAALKRFALEFPSPMRGLTHTQWLLMQAVYKPLTELPAYLSRLQVREQMAEEASVTSSQQYQSL